MTIYIGLIRIVCYMLKMSCLTSMWITVIVAISPSYSHADVYKYIDETGNTLYTNVYRGEKNAERVAKGSNTEHLNGKPYRHIIARVSEKFGIEPSVIAAVIAAESNWQYDAVSSKGAIGLMQLMPATIREMKVRDPYDPADNIEGGTKYLRRLLDRFNGDLELALAAYNAGPDRVSRYGGIPPIRETRGYIKKVLAIEKSEAGSGSSSFIYKVIFDDSTILYTNNPSRYKEFKPSRF